MFDNFTLYINMKLFSFHHLATVTGQKCAMEVLKRKRCQLRRLVTKYTTEFFEAETSVVRVLVLKKFEEKADLLDKVDKELVDTVLVDEGVSEDEVTTLFDEIEFYREKVLTCRHAWETEVREEGSMRSYGDQSAIGESKRKYKLPPIELKRLGESIKDWLGFWGQFKKIANAAEKERSDCSDVVIVNEKDSKVESEECFDNLEKQDRDKTKVKKTEIEIASKVQDDKVNSVQDKRNKFEHFVQDDKVNSEHPEKEKLANVLEDEELLTERIKEQSPTEVCKDSMKIEEVKDKVLCNPIIDVQSKTENKEVVGIIKKDTELTIIEEQVKPEKDLQNSGRKNRTQMHSFNAKTGKNIKWSDETKIMDLNSKVCKAGSTETVEGISNSEKLELSETSKKHVKKKLIQPSGREILVIYLVGAIISIAGCLWVRTGVGTSYRHVGVYGIAILLGAGSSITMVASLCLTADLIGANTESGAFVYSIVTFADKLLNGIAVIFIEDLQCKSYWLCPHYYRDVLAYVCGGSALFGIIALSTLFSTRVGELQKQSELNGRQTRTP